VAWNFRQLVKKDGAVVDNAEAGVDDGLSGLELDPEQMKRLKTFSLSVLTGLFPILW
jgi:hypothetical protein